MRRNTGRVLNKGDAMRINWGGIAVIAGCAVVNGVALKAAWLVVVAIWSEI